MDEKRINRDLDGFYFRVKRGEKWDSVCFSDLTSDERMSVMEGRSEDWLKSLCNGIAESLRAVGDEFNICAVSDDMYGYEDEIADIPFVAYENNEEE